MAKILGPYRKNNINLSNDANPSQVTFWGFSEDDTDLLRFRMSDQLAAAITQALKNGIKDPNGTWTEADTQRYIEFYAEVFKDAELIPYVYPLKIQREGNVEGNYIHQSRGIMSSTMNNVTNMWGGIADSINTWLINKNEFINTGEIEAVSTKSDDALPYVMTETMPVNYQKNMQLMRKSEINNIVVKPTLTQESLPINSRYRRSIAYISEESLFNNGSATSGAVNVLIGENNKLCVGQKTLSNIEDGKYNTENVRVTCMERLRGIGDLESPDNKTVGGNQNSYVFFVKTKFPWYTYLTNNIDNELPSTQYWAFNITSLFAPTPVNGYPLQYASYTDATEHMAMTGLPMKSTDRVTDVNLPAIDYANIPWFYYIPFGYYIAQNTDYFSNKNVYGFGTSTVECNSPSFQSINAASRRGAFIAGTESEWERFFRDGLGIYNTTTNNTEFTSMNTEEWANPPVKPAPESPIQPGTGGQTPGTGTPSGGSGIGGTDEDITTSITPPTTSTGGGRITRQYAMTGASVNGLQDNLINNTVWDNITTIFKANPQEGLVNLIQFPFTIPVTPNDETIKVLGQQMSYTGEEKWVLGTPINRNVPTAIDFGTFDIKERFGSFLDYQYTSLNLYIPFVGNVGLNASDVMGRRIKVVNDIDYGDGSCLATIWVTNNRNTWGDIESGGYHPLSSHQGQIGTQIPLSSSNAREKSQNELKAIVGSGLAVGAATGVAAPLAYAAVAGLAASIATPLLGVDPPNYSPGGVVNSNHTWSVSTDCILTIVYPEVDFADNQAKITGYPCNFRAKLGDQLGFTMCNEVKLNGLNCTDKEADMIKGLLTEGVIINE